MKETESTMTKGLWLQQKKKKREKVLHGLYAFNDKMEYLSISVYELGLNAQ